MPRSPLQKISARRFRSSVSSDVLVAVRDEAAAFAQVLAGLPAPDWDRPTRCDPWRVRDVVGHVITVLARVPAMVAAPPPERADTTATSYYRADQRFSEEANADRVLTARRRAAAGEVAALADDLAATARTVIAAGRQAPEGRIVRTRHGDAILLEDFLTTRVVELAVHGLDVADALGRPPWLTATAAQCLQRLLFGPGWQTAVATLGWPPETLLRRTTGRGPVTVDESAALAELGLRPLTVG